MSVSVTTVLDYLTERELLEWMLRTPKAKREAVSNESKLIGGIVDGLIQNSLRDAQKEIEIPEGCAKAVASCMIAWGKFKKEYPNVVASIQAIQLELEHNGVIGHPDIFCEDDKHWGIIDVKTSRAMYPGYWTQTSEYTELKRWSHHTDHYLKKPRFVAILRLDKETESFHYLEMANEEFIAYKVRIFEAYHLAYKDAFESREYIRCQLEEEVLGVR